MILLNNKEVNIKKFPNGESLLEIDNITICNENNTITLKFENDEDLIHLMFIKKHLDSLNLQSDLILTYVPYSRMDRTEGVAVFTLKHMCNFINKLNFNFITICEPHSDVCIALLDRVKVMNTSRILTKKLMDDLYFSENKGDYLFSPDAGAQKRYQKQIKFNNVLVANKERDFKTGRIKSLTIQGDIKDQLNRVIIIDDLCSRGGTFMLSAEKLKEIGVKEIYLVITHCEDTIFDGEILNSDLIKKIYTTDSILSETHNKINVVTVMDILKEAK